MLRWMIYLLALAVSLPAAAANWQGQLDLEGRRFLQPGLYAGQQQTEASAALLLENYHDFDPDLRLTFTGFLRADSQDPRRSYGDIRELALTWVGNGLEIQAGINKVFWGVTESFHLVDIINQTDVVESPNLEAKLGQPMLKVAVERDWGNLDLFILPGFRERRFPGPNGRLRPPVAISSQARYEDTDEEKHIDYALRFSRSLDDWDLGLSAFKGTSRDPSLLPGINGQGQLTLTPYYEQITQWGLDVQYIDDAWLWKLEAIYRNGQGTKDYIAAVTGLEYTVYSLFDSVTDLGIVAELLWDQRGDRATTPMNHDLMLGLRWVGNDEAGTEALLGVIQDLEQPSRMVYLEASRRLGVNWKGSLEMWLFNGIDPIDPVYASRRDGFVRLVMTRYF